MYPVGEVSGIHPEALEIRSCRVRDSQIKIAYQEGNIERCQAIRSIFPECDRETVWFHKGEESPKEDGVLLESFFKRIY